MPDWVSGPLEYVLDFSNVLNASISASWLILVVILLRFGLKKAPKWVNVALWGIVALRLLMPFSIESALSLIPSAQTVSDQLLQAGPVPGAEAAYLEIVSNPSYGGTVTVELDQSISAFQWDMMYMTFPWLLGMVLMAIYTAVSYWQLRKKVDTAVILRDNIFLSEQIPSPFVLGIIKPRIYLPFSLDGESIAHVIAHEQAHIRRRDHWWKPLGFLLLTIHWFNPLMWLAYILLCRDIELACDEKVISELGNEQRADYTQALVACSVSRLRVSACPLAFGEVGVKERVRAVLHYRKPTFWLILAALFVCGTVAVCFLTDPGPSREFAMHGDNVSGLDPEAIEARILEIEDITNSGVYVNSLNFSLQVDSGFHWADSQTIRFFFQKDHRTESAQLRIFPEEDMYFLTESDEWQDQEEIFLLRHYLEAVKHLPQSEILQMAPADQYIIQHIAQGSPSDFDRVITYSSDGVTPIDGWNIHLQVQPLHRDGEGYHGTGEEVIELFYSGTVESVEEKLGDIRINRPYGVAQVIYESPHFDFSTVPQENTPEYFVDESLHLHSVKEHSAFPDWTDLGELTEISLTEDNFDDLFSGKRGEGWHENKSASAIRRNIEKAWSVIYDQDKLYYLLQLKNGELYLAYGYYDYSEKDDPGSDDTSIRWLYRLGGFTEADTLRLYYSNSETGITIEKYVKEPQIVGEIFSMYRSVEVEEYGRPISPERIKIEFYSHGMPVDEWYVSYYEADDEVVTACDAFGRGTRRVTSAFRYERLLELFRQAPVSMIPIDTELLGFQAGALLVPLDGSVYRYLSSGIDPEGVTAEELLYAFEEPDLYDVIGCEVYSLKEYPDHSAVLLLSEMHGASVYTYRAPGRCEDTALEDAIQAGYVVIEDGEPTQGQNIWKYFYELTRQGKPASVTVAKYTTLDPQRCDYAYYEVFGGDYPSLGLYQLSYDGNVYTLTVKDSGEVYTKTYEYLMCYDTTENFAASSQIPGRRLEYVLTHDNTVTWDQLWNGMISSQAGAYIEYSPIYREKG